MGKKSRLKRERREKAEQGEFDQQDIMNKYVSGLENIFSKYNAQDVYISLMVSDLWLPNISSIGKHYLAFGTFLSMDVKKFKNKSGLHTYEKFKKFIEQVHSILPDMRMLEDYIPEPDWGEIKVLIRGKYYRTFYGGSIERITDFIEAFNLLYSSIEESRKTKSEPINDLMIALQFQHQILTTIDQPPIENHFDIFPGYIETPSKHFWTQCRNNLPTVFSFPKGIQPSPELVVEQGSFNMVKSMEEFVEALFSGTFMPAILVKIKSEHFPISGRNISGEVINYWTRKIKPNKQVLVKNMAEFIKSRLGYKQTIAIHELKYRLLFCRTTSIASPIFSY